MATITLKYDARNTNTKNLIDSLVNMGIFIIEKKEEDTQYSETFIKKIHNAETNVRKGKTTKINPNKLWESIQ